MCGIQSFDRIIFEMDNLLGTQTSNRIRIDVSDVGRFQRTKMIRAKLTHLSRVHILELLFIFQ